MIPCPQFLGMVAMCVIWENGGRCSQRRGPEQGPGRFPCRVQADFFDREEPPPVLVPPLLKDAA